MDLLELMIFFVWVEEDFIDMMIIIGIYFMLDSYVRVDFLRVVLVFNNVVLEFKEVKDMFYW